MRVVPFSVAVALVGALACKAQVQANAEANVGKEEVADFNKPLDHPVESEAPEFEGARGQALLGARPDLSYGGQPSATCKCLAVAVGQPGDPSFRWSGERPRTNPDSQLVIAVTASGVSCPEGGSSLGASYWGYEVDRDDVVVVVEPAVAGRPLTTGAIIPRPLGKGRVYVRPSDKKVPYGRPASGGGARCQVGQASDVAAKPNPMIPPSAASARVRIRSDEAPSDGPEVTMP